MAIQEFVRHLACRALVGQFQGFGSVPLDRHDRGLSIREDSPDTCPGGQLFQFDHGARIYAIGRNRPDRYGIEGVPACAKAGDRDQPRRG